MLTGHDAPVCRVSTTTYPIVDIEDPHTGWFSRFSVFLGYQLIVRWIKPARERVRGCDLKVLGRGWLGKWGRSKCIYDYVGFFTFQRVHISFFDFFYFALDIYWSHSFSLAVDVSSGVDRLDAWRAWTRIHQGPVLDGQKPPRWLAGSTGSLLETGFSWWARQARI